MSHQQTAPRTAEQLAATAPLLPLRPDAFATPYRDPVWDGPTDPILVADHLKGEWVLLYTQRRAAAPGLTGVEWVHGTGIGVAGSSDGGATWRYQGTVEGLVPPGTETPATLWAPDVVRLGDRWIMYLTVLGGRRTDWTGKAEIVQFASQDLESWEYLGAIDLDSPRVIDAAVARCGDGRYRLWYKDEGRGSNTYSAVSGTPEDPSSWVLEGVAIPGRPHEGPKVFQLGGSYWMIVDEWRGQAVYRSDDAAAPGSGRSTSMGCSSRRRNRWTEGPSSGAMPTWCPSPAVPGRNQRLERSTAARSGRCWSTSRIPTGAVRTSTPWRRTRAPASATSGQPCWKCATEFWFVPNTRRWVLDTQKGQTPEL